jgi:hypothetical protein
MRDRTWVVIGICFAGLFLACFGQVLFRGHQFAYRDSGHFYYPLYQHVQKEWNAGRWPPLWEPEENGGMPLLGNPTAAVLYPGKIIYALLPYPWAARVYVIAHTALAFAAMLCLMRSWNASWTAAGISALSYAFGAPVLFQYCNIIYLVGAAWLPLGIRAVDRWLRLGERRSLLLLAVVLAMETLGGEPEVAYVTGLCAAGYALVLARRRMPKGKRPGSRVPIVVLGIVGIAMWTALTLFAALYLPAMRPEPARFPPRAFAWMPWVPWAVGLAWGILGVIVVTRWYRRQWRWPAATMLAGLLGAAALAASLSAVQLLPVLEFTRRSGRSAGEGTHDIYPFSLAPIRLGEFLWPNVSGTAFNRNRGWLIAIPNPTLHSEVWVPSLYVGGLTLILAVGAAGFRGASPWRGWLTAIAVLSLLAALGEFTSPLWWARWSPAVARQIGPHDTVDTATIRHDMRLRDGDGGFYWALATILPGFKQFRFPCKLLTFTALAISGLAGLGWDGIVEGRWRRTAVFSAAGAAASLVVLAVVFANRTRIIAAFGTLQGEVGSAFGPLEPEGAFADLAGGLIQAAAVLAVGFALVLAASRRRSSLLANALAIAVVTIDLGVANVRYILTEPQSLFTTKPRVVSLLEQAEREKPGASPYFRTYRVPLWSPPNWRIERSDDRVRDFVEWERMTIQPKYGLEYGVDYTRTLGVAELYDFEWFFGPFLRSTSPEVARSLGVKVGEKIVVYPRRGFDFWNTRYFILPAHPGDWKDAFRGFASFLGRAERVYPPLDAFKGPDGRKRQDEWLRNEDFQILRNLDEFPRAWVVHNARWVTPFRGLTRDERDVAFQEILFQNDPLWSDPNLPVYDPHTLAWLDDDKASELQRYLPGTIPGLVEPVKITSYSPERVELEASLERPGLVILADIYYPGWKLTIDGKEAPVYRANRMMRAAAVPSGTHRLVYRFDPGSYRLGKVISLVALGVFVVLAAAFARWPRSSSLAAASEPVPRDVPIHVPPEALRADDAVIK